MAATARSLRLNDQYRSRLLDVRNRSVIAIAASWRAMSIHTYDQAFPGWLRAATATIANAQAHTATLSNQFAATYVASERGRAHQPTPLELSRYVGRTRDGRPVAQVLALADVSTRTALAYGARPEQAMEQGLGRAVRATRTEVMDAGRAALGAAMVHDAAITGWQRIPSSNPCGACLALSDAGPRATDEDLEIHASCSCTAIPIVGGVPNNVEPLVGMALFESKTPDEQDALFEGRGGAAKAELIRNGDITLEQLKTNHHHPEWVDEVYETPLAQLTPAAATADDD